MDELISLIQTELRIETPIDANTPLLSSGLIDSLGVVTLLTILEEEYGVILDEASVSVDTFDTPAQIYGHLTAGARSG